MELTLKAPGSKRLKVIYGTLLSTSAFNFNLRRYSQGKNLGCYATEEAAARAYDDYVASGVAPAVKPPAIQKSRFKAGGY